MVFKFEFEPAVLRGEVNINLQTGKYLDAGDDRVIYLFRELHDVAQNTINAVPHQHLFREAFNVNVRSAERNRVFHKPVGDGDNRHMLGHFPNIFDVARRERFLNRLFNDRIEFFVNIFFVFLKSDLHRQRCGEIRLHAHIEFRGDKINGFQIARVFHREFSDLFFRIKSKQRDTFCF